MTRSKRWVGILLGGAVPLLAASACFDVGDLTFDDGDDDLLLLGTIVAQTATTGPSPDPDGYVVRLDESRAQPIEINGGVTFSDLRVGGWSVSLEGVALNCAVAPSTTIDVMLFADSVFQTNFDVTCN